MEKERFSLLLLEPGEIYFEDFSCILISINDESSSIDGRLKMCSKSIVFDPKDITLAVIKIPLKECIKIDLQTESIKHFDNIDRMLVVCCKQYVEMLAGNELAPYKFKSGKKFVFVFNYAKVSNILPQICQLQRATTLSAAEQNAMIATIVHSRHARFKFDPLWMTDLHEQILCNIQVEKITPLVVNPGRIVISTERLYFQPYNNAESYPVLKIDIKSLKRIIPRRFLLRHVGLEMYCSCDQPISYLYLAFHNSLDRNKVYESLLSRPNLNLDKTEQDVMTLQWQNGVISNYEYLLYINSLGDRTFNDLTQYPVFPWVLTNYVSEVIDINDEKNYRDLSKPVGALDDNRFKKLQERYNEMSDPKFMYGSHYSAPGLVLFYLVRKYPHYMLCLQNGRFDHPDRMFNSISDVFRNCLKNMSDFKELIPEFYDISQKGLFLINSKGINFGYRSDGNKIEDVKLPPWAKSADDFIRILRNGLESDFVSKNLNHWIDLIFGYKQKGIDAEKSNNLFYHLCYEGAVNLDSIKDLNERHALEVQIMEFGQIPKQVFAVPHPQRRLAVPVILGLSETNNQTTHKSFSLELLSSLNGHKDKIGSIIISDDNDSIISVGHDSVLKIISIKQCRQLRSINVGNMALSSCVQLPDKNTLAIGCWDDYIIFYDIECGRIISPFRAHDDAVSVLAWNTHLKHLASGSWDCNVYIWKNVENEYHRPPRPAQCLVAHLEHDSQITCIAYSPDGAFLATGTQDGELHLWNTTNYSSSQQLQNHSKSVRAVCFSEDGNKFISCGDDCVFNVIDLKTGTMLFKKDLGDKLVSLVWSNVTLLIGSDAGFIYVWDMIQVKMTSQMKVHKDSLSCITVSKDNNFVVTGGQDNSIKIWKVNLQ